MGRWEARHILHFDASEVINRYARGFDRKDWDLVRTCFHSDAVDDHGSTVGRAEDFVAFMRLRHRANCRSGVISIARGGRGCRCRWSI